MKILETERLLLREFEKNDIEAMWEIYANEEVMKYIGSGVPGTKEHSEKMINVFRKSYKDNGYGIWALAEKETGSLIGHCGFSLFQDKSDIEIAYLLAKEYWGKGIATEISGAVLEHGLSKLSFKKVVALVYPENKASQNVIKKIGLKQEGERKFFGKIFLFYSVFNLTYDNNEKQNKYFK